jgi:hypothetical protein
MIASKHTIERADTHTNEATPGFCFVFDLSVGSMHLIRKPFALDEVPPFRAKELLYERARARERASEQARERERMYEAFKKNETFRRGGGDGDGNDGNTRTAILRLKMKVSRRDY